MRFTINIDGIDEIKQSLEKIKNLYKDREYLKFLMDKSYEVVIKQTNQRLTKLQEDNTVYSKYKNNHHKQMLDDGFEIYNDTINDKWDKYTFSIAEAVEYGVGITGQMSGAYGVEETGYQYDVNKHGSKGWVYLDEENNLKFTTGYQGRNIYYYSAIEISERLQEWTNEYIERYI